MWKSKKLQIYVHNLYIPYMESEGNKIKYISKKETISSKQKRTRTILLLFRIYPLEIIIFQNSKKH